MTNRIQSTKLEFAVSCMATLLAFVAIGCSAGEIDNGGGSAVENRLTVSCPASLAGWAIGTSYKVGGLVSFKGAVFSCRQAHTAVDGWFPDIVPALWLPAQCNNGTPATPPAPQPPAPQPPAPQPPSSPDAAHQRPVRRWPGIRSRGREERRQRAGLAVHRRPMPPHCRLRLGLLRVPVRHLLGSRRSVPGWQAGLRVWRLTR